MSKKLNDISAKIDSNFIEIFQAMDEVIQKLGIQYFIIGATARDIILKYCHGITRNYRATQDIDFGIQISNWDEFVSLKKSLLALDSFSEDREKVHRLHFNESIPIDLVPFGNIADDTDNLSWPPNHDIEMSVLGFEEAYEYSQLVRINKEPILDINFASLEGLFIMKLIAWKESRSRRLKDATDISIILDNYDSAEIQEILFQDEKLLNADDFDSSNAFARILGRRVSKMAKTKTIETIIEILDKEIDDKSNYQLARDMGDRTRFSNQVETNIILLNNVRQGISDIINMQIEGN